MKEDKILEAYEKMIEDKNKQINEGKINQYLTEKKENINPKWKNVAEVEKTITNALDKLADELDLPPVPYSVIKNMMKVFRQKYS